MARPLLMPLALAAVLCLTAGCGRKGLLDTPYEAAVEARQEAIRNNQQPVPPEPTPPPANRRFVLDPLL